MESLYLFNMFMSKDITDFRAKLHHWAYCNFETKGYLEMSGEWLEDDPIKEKLVEAVLKLQDNIVGEMYQVLEIVDDWEESKNKDFGHHDDSESLACKFVYRFQELLDCKRHHHRGVDLLQNFKWNEEDAPTKETVKKFLKIYKKFRTESRD